MIGKNPAYMNIYHPPGHPRCNCSVTEILVTDKQPTFYPTLNQPEPATDAEVDRINESEMDRVNDVVRTWDPATGEYGSPLPTPTKPKPTPAVKPKPAPRKPRKPAAEEPVGIIEPTAEVAPETTPARKEPANSESHEDVERWAKQTFPAAKMVLQEKIPVESWAVIASELDDLAKLYPGVAKDLQLISTISSSFYSNPRAVASAGIIGNTIAFNPAYFKSIQDVKTLVEENSQSGFFPQGVDDPRYVITHEFGHLIDAWIDKNKPDIQKKIRAAISAPGGYPYVDADKAYSVSAYAATDAFEMIAECFAAANYVPKSSLPEVARIVMSLIKEATKK